MPLYKISQTSFHNEQDFNSVTRQNSRTFPRLKLFFQDIFLASYMQIQDETMSLSLKVIVWTYRHIQWTDSSISTNKMVCKTKS